ncbi:MAG: AmmeMemoRadiSam system radical SAM enzyme [Candidatus Krumholzibacteriia bacterium]
MTVTARYWHVLPDGRIACDLCPVGCKLREGQDGLCRTRGVTGGRLVAHQYGLVVSAGVDPIEKKPLYHYHPGQPILSVAALGCNLHCEFCQNWTISQRGQGPTTRMSPEDVVAAAHETGSFGVAYTYSEPLVWFEFVLDTARRVRTAGLKNVVVTNGYLNAEPLAELLPWLDAANVDLKGMDERFYERVCHASLQPVLHTITAMHRAGVHVEVTNLVIPGHNDSDEHLRDLARFLGDLDPDLALHLSAYRPAYKFDAPPTPAATLRRAAGIARERLRHVYVGNLHVDGATDTVCAACGRVLVRRLGYRTRTDLAAGPSCPGCGAAAPIRID